ncbi:MAG: hypothetical protein GY847_33700 [Proteobacteria bacterium]|nr:hypothetical protein [Pseudomonadota bacterium]
MRKNICQNLNHRRPNPQVRFCLSCGETVNSNVPIKQCSEIEHAKKRKQHCMFCVNCGERLRK